MKRMKQILWSLSGCLIVLAPQAARAIEKPAVLPEAMVSITVPDLHGFLDEAGIVAAKGSPGMSGMMLKSLLGMQLGDPGLAGIAPGKGLAVVMPDITNQYIYVEVGEAQSAAYANAAKAMGMTSKYAGGLLVLGKSPAILAKAEGLVPAVQKTLLARRSAVLRISGQPSSIIERNTAAIEGSLAQMTSVMGMGMQQTGGGTNSVENLMKIFEGEMRLFLSLGSQVEACEVALAPKDGAVQIRETFVPKAGTRLAALVNSPKVGKSNPKVQSGLLGDAMIAVDLTMGNPEALATFVVEESDELMKTLGVKGEDVGKLVGTMQKWVAIYKGSAAETVDFDPEDGMSAKYIVEVSDEAQAMALFRTMEKDMAPFLDLYKGMGMEMSLKFKENDREYKGIKIHRFDMGMKMEQMLPEQKKQFEAMKLDKMGYDMALVDGLMLYALGSGNIEELIDKVKDPAAKVEPIEARGVFPAGGFYYLDLDIGRYMELITSLMPEEAKSPMQAQVMALLQGVDPITSAGFREGGLVSWSLNIPGDLIGRLSQIGMMMQMQQMQQQQGRPGAMPGATPGAMPGAMPGDVPEALPVP